MKNETGQPIRIMMRPTRKAALCFSLSVPVALIVVTAFSQAWYVALYLPLAALAFIVADTSMALPGAKVRASLKLPPRLYVGRAASIAATLNVAWSGRAPVGQLLLAYGGDQPPAILYPTLTGGTQDLEFALTPQRRGRIAVNALWMRWRGPLGLVEIRRTQPVQQYIDITPDVKGIHEAALQFLSREAVYGVKTQHMRGEGTEFDTLCDYAQGMDNRFIDWKRSARHRKLLCKEFRQERNHHVMLGFDTGHLMLEPANGMPKLDHAIKAGLLLGWISLYSGDLVGGFGFDARLRNFIKPGRGMPYFTQFQSFSSALDYHAEETNFTLGLAELDSRLQRRSLVVLFTEFVDSISAELLLESLQRISRRHVVVFVTMRDPMLASLQNKKPQVFSDVAEAVLAGNFLRERAIVLERVARLGVHCLDVPPQGMSAALLNRYLLIKQRGLL